jgi:hypothetical protein
MRGHQENGACASQQSLHAAQRSRRPPFDVDLHESLTRQNQIVQRDDGEHSLPFQLYRQMTRPSTPGQVSSTPRRSANAIVARVPFHEGRLTQRRRVLRRHRWARAGVFVVSSRGGH